MYYDDLFWVFSLIWFTVLCIAALITVIDISNS